MGSFNFGAPRIPGFKKKVGAWTEPKRGDTPILPDDIIDIAAMYYIDDDSLVYIGKRYDVGPKEIRSIVNGFNFGKDWSKACVQLISEGHTLVRSKLLREEDKRATRGALRTKPLTMETVRSIRLMHMAGVELEEIVRKTGLKTYRVRSILRNDTFKQDEYKPPGWRMDTTNWRKDSD
jgi:hypothetical protein